MKVGQRLEFLPQPLADKSEPDKLGIASNRKILDKPCLTGGPKLGITMYWHGWPSMVRCTSTSQHLGKTRAGLGAGAMIILVLGLAGCQMDPRARREIALLRSELIALEDRYTILRNRCGDDSNGFDEGPSIHAPAGEINETISPTNPGNSSRPSRQNQRRVPPEELILDLEEPPPIEPPADKNQDGISSRNLRSLSESAAFMAGPEMNFDLKIQVVPRDLNRDQIDDGMIVKIPCTAPESVEALQVSMLDPELPSGQQRIGYWTLDRRAIRQLEFDAQTRMLHFAIDWESQPRNPALLIFARLTTSNSVSEGSESFISRVSSDQGIFGGDPGMHPPPRSTTLLQSPANWRPNR
jgi:hypothetical protein